MDALELAALLRADQWKRWQRGDRIPVEEYLRQLPEAGDAVLILDLVSGEVSLRERRGETPTADEYVKRFPQLEAELRRQFQMRAGLGKGDFAAPGIASAEPAGPTGTFQPETITAATAAWKFTAASPPPVDRVPERPIQRGFGKWWLATFLLLIIALAITTFRSLHQLMLANAHMVEQRADLTLAMVGERAALAEAHQIAEERDEAVDALLGAVLAEMVVRRSAEAARLKTTDELRTLRLTSVAQLYELFEERRLAGQIDAARVLLEKVPPDLRGWEWPYLRQLCERERRTWTAHPAGVSCLAAAPVGSVVVSGGADGTARLWNVGADREGRSFAGHRGKVNGVALDWSGRWLATGGEDGVAKTWDLPTGAEIAVCKGHTGPVTCVAFSLDGKLLATGGTDKTVRLWDSASGEEIARLTGHASTVSALAFSPDGRRLASAGWDNIAILWDAAEGERLLTFQGHDKIVGCLAFSRDGKHLVTGSHDHSVRTWDAGTGRELRLLTGHTGIVAGVAFSSDGKWIVSVGKDNKVRTWDSAGGKELAAFEGRGRWLGGLALSPEGKRLVTFSEGPALIEWDLTGEPDCQVLPANSNRVSCAAFSPDGSRLAVGVGFKDPNIRPPRTPPIPHLFAWDLAAGKQQFRVPVSGVMNFDVAFSPDGSALALGGDGAPLRIFDAANGKVQATFPGVFGARHVCYSPDGRWLAALAGDRDLFVLDAAAQKEARSVKVPVELDFRWLMSLAFSPDGKRILLTRGKKQWLVDLGRQTLQLEGPAAPESSGREGERRVQRDPETTLVHFSDPVTGITVARITLPVGMIPPDQPSHPLVFAPDGSRLVVLLFDRILIWNAGPPGPLNAKEPRP
jgi:WD40 repeat protein